MGERVSSFPGKHQTGCAMSKLQYLALLAACFFSSIAAHAQPAFHAGTSGQLSVQISGDDIYPFNIANNYLLTTGTGAPETVSVSGGRNSGTVSTQITQVAPYILNGAYWAGTWTSTIEATEGAGGQFGVHVGAAYHGAWYFGIDGLTANEVAHTTFYYAATWNTTAYEDLTPDYAISGGLGGIGRSLFSPVYGYGAPSGSYSGSFMPWDFASSNYIGFNVLANPTGAFQVNPGNGPSSIDFTYSIAFSTTPIDASVFSPPVAEIPEPETYAMLLAGLGLLGFAARRRKLKEAAAA